MSHAKKKDRFSQALAYFSQIRRLCVAFCKKETLLICTLQANFRVRLDRKCYGKGRADAYFAHNRDGAMMFFDDVLSDFEPQKEKGIT